MVIVILVVDLCHCKVTVILYARCKTDGSRELQEEKSKTRSQATAAGEA